MTSMPPMSDNFLYWKYTTIVKKRKSPPAAGGRHETPHVATGPGGWRTSRHGKRKKEEHYRQTLPTDAGGRDSCRSLRAA